MALCDRCGNPTQRAANEYGDFICDGCEQKAQVAAAEAAAERLSEDFHDGGSTQFISLQQQQIAALKFK